MSTYLNKNVYDKSNRQINSDEIDLFVLQF